MLLDLVRAGAPAQPLLTLEDAKLAIRVDHNDEDSLIQAFIDAAIDQLDGYDGILGRALVDQTWRLGLGRFPFGPIELPLPPLIAVTSIAYVDVDGEAQTLPADDYLVHDGALAMIEPAYGKSWPSTRAQKRAVTITFRAGYGAPEDVPAGVLAAARLMVGDLYANRETGVVGTVSADIKMSTTVSRLLAPHKVPRI